MCFYYSTNNDLIDARFFYLILRVMKEHFPYFELGVEQDAMYKPGEPNENIVQNHLNIALLNVF